MKSISETLQTIGGKNYNSGLPETPNTSPLCRTYNNVYGSVSGTHMYQANEEVYIITGPRLSSSLERFTMFCVSPIYGTHVMKPDGINIMSLNQWLSKYGLVVKENTCPISRELVPNEKLPKDNDFLIVVLEKNFYPNPDETEQAKVPY